MSAWFFLKYYAMALKKYAQATYSSPGIGVTTRATTIAEIAKVFINGILSDHFCASGL